MVKLFLLVLVSIQYLDSNAQNHQVSLDYAKYLSTSSTNIFEIENQQMFKLNYIINHLYVDVRFENISFYENGHRTDALNQFERTFYGYFGKGSKNQFSYVSLGLGGTFTFFEYFRFTAGFSIGLTTKKRTSPRLFDENGNYVFSININDTHLDNVNRGRAQLFQTLSFEKQVYKNIGFTLGYSLLSSVSELIYVDSPRFENATLNDRLTQQLNFGLVYSF